MIWLRKSKNVHMAATRNVNGKNMHVRFMSTSIMKRVWAICAVKWRS